MARIVLDVSDALKKELKECAASRGITLTAFLMQGADLNMEGSHVEEPTHRKIQDEGQLRRLNADSEVQQDLGDVMHTEFKPFNAGLMSASTDPEPLSYDDSPQNTDF